MSDSAFPTAAYPGYTSDQLAEMAAAPHTPADKARVMRDEITRRTKARAGDVFVMTPGERLRHVRGQNPR